MQVQVWADFHCPYCYFGIERLRRAMEELQLEEATINVRSYLLNPNTEPGTDMRIVDYVVQQYGSKIDNVRRQNALLERRGKELGLYMDLERSRFGNMMDPHRLLQHMKTLGLESQFFDRAQRALFSEGELLSDHEVLLKLGEELGVFREEVIQVLESDQYKEEVLADNQEARSMDIDFVPYYIFPDGHAISGERKYEEYLASLKRAMDAK